MPVGDPGTRRRPTPFIDSDAPAIIAFARAAAGGRADAHYVELELEQRWVKASPAFARALCDRQGQASQTPPDPANE